MNDGSVSWCWGYKHKKVILEWSVSSLSINDTFKNWIWFNVYWFENLARALVTVLIFVLGKLHWLKMTHLNEHQTQVDLRNYVDLALALTWLDLVMRLDLGKFAIDLTWDLTTVDLTWLDLRLELRLRSLYNTGVCITMSVRTCPH